MRIRATLLIMFATLSLRADETLQNASVRLSLSADGRLTELTNLRTGLNYAGGKPVWDLYCHYQDSMEEPAMVEASRGRVVRERDTLVLRYDSIQSRRGPLAIRMEFRVRLEGDETRWSAELSHNEKDLTVTELHFPLVGACRFKPTQALIWSTSGGERFESIRDAVRRRHTAYDSADNAGIRMTAMYPGTSASTNSFTLAGDGEGLYFGSHDPTFQLTLHSLRMQGEDVAAGLGKYPFLPPGKTFRADGYVISPYSGNWHVAAKKYRAWANSWFVPVRKPDWVVNEMTGWQRVMIKQQYGELLHPYSEIPQVISDGLTAGINALMPFGWWKGGTDNDYTNYICDERQGGCDALLAGFRKAQARRVRILLYFHGWGIEPNTEYYRRVGHRIAVKDNTLREVEWRHVFGGAGTAVKRFRGRHVAQACAASREWTAALKQYVDQAFQFGADSIFYDSLGTPEYPCCDAGHGHPVPFTTAGKARAEQLREVREYIKDRNPNMGLGTEIPADIISQHADYVHSITGATALTGVRPGGKPRSTGYLEWFRYIYPEIILTDRDIRDDTDVERRVNHLLLLGLRSDVAVFRCRGTIRDAPKYGSYLAKANALMTRHASFLMAGTFCDTDFFRLSNDEIDARSFRSGNRLAVVLTQSHLAKASTDLTVPGYTMTAHDGIGNFAVQQAAGAARVSLGRDGLALVVFQKK